MASAFALLASLMWGFTYFVGGRLSQSVSAFSVTAVSSAVTALFFLVTGLAQGQLSFDNVDVVAGVVAGAMTLLANVCLFTALSRGTMGVVGGISALLVVIPLVWSVGQGDPLTITAVSGVLLTVVGVIMLGAPEMRGATSRSAVLLALLAAGFFGIQQVAITEGSVDDPYVTLFLAQLLVTVLLGVVGTVRRTTGGITRRSLAPLVFVGLTNALAFAAFAAGTLRGDPGLVSALAALDPVVLAILAFVVLRQRMAAVQVAALGVVLLGATAITLA